MVTCDGQNIKNTHKYYINSFQYNYRLAAVQYGHVHMPSGLFCGGLCLRTRQTSVLDNCHGVLFISRG